MGEIQRTMVHVFQADMRRKFARALQKGLVGVNGEVRDFARRLQNGNFGNPEDVQVEFTKVAEDMHAALLASYNTEVQGRKVVPSYRAGDGRLPGALGEVLKNKTMAVADGHGISYINRTLLDEQAKHWKRLNFGAAGYRVSGTNNLRVPVPFDSRILFYAGSEAGVRPGFALPAGRFIDPRSGKRVPYGVSDKSAYSGDPPTTDKFFPGGGGRGRIIQSGGIEGRHYIDAGFAVLAKDFGPALQRLYGKWTAKAGAGVRPTRTV